MSTGAPPRRRPRQGSAGFLPAGSPAVVPWQLLALAVPIILPPLACAAPPLTGYDAQPGAGGEGVVLRGHLAPDAPDPVPRILDVRERENCSGSGQPGQFVSAQCLEFGVISVSLQGRTATVICSRQDARGCKALFEHLAGTSLLPGPGAMGGGATEVAGATAGLRGCRVVADDGTDLGGLGSTDDPDSVCNPFGRTGSPYALDGVWNRHGRHGGEFSPTGALNRHAQRPPRILCNGAVAGRFSRNLNLPGAVDPSAACSGREE